jgi:hypothetical protein
MAELTGNWKCRVCSIEHRPGESCLVALRRAGGSRQTPQEPRDGLSEPSGAPEPEIESQEPPEAAESQERRPAGPRRPKKRT